MRLIDTIALVNYLMLNMNWYDEDGRTVDDYDEKRSIIENLVAGVPTVDTKPVQHGRWVKMTGMMPPECIGHYECSECGWHGYGFHSAKNTEQDYRYCPNCGAKMDGEADAKID